MSIYKVDNILIGGKSSSNKQINLLYNIKEYISILNKTIYKIQITKEIHNELMDFLSKNILSQLSKEKINFDLDLLKSIFNINPNKSLLRGKSLFFLYEYICYNLFKDKDFVKLMCLGMYDIDLYDNVMYINDFHIFNNGELLKLMEYIGYLNLLKKYDEYYIYTDKPIKKVELNIVFNIIPSANTIHIHNNIYINDKLFLEYINIPYNILIEYPNNKVYNDYFNNLGIHYKNYYNNNYYNDNEKSTNLICITNNKFKNINPYTNTYNFIAFYLLKEYDNKKHSKEELDYFYKIVENIFKLYKIYKDEYNYKKFPFNDFNNTKINSNQFKKDIIYCLYPNLDLIDKKYHKDIIKKINSFIISLFRLIKEP